jgi:hypothetical protein
VVHRQQLLAVAADRETFDRGDPQLLDRVFFRRDVGLC